MNRAAACLERWLALDGASRSHLVARELEALAAGERAEVVEMLKARIDAAVRTSPPTALPLSELLGELGPLVPARRALAERGRAVALHANGRSDEALPHYVAAVEAYTALGEVLECARVRRSLVDVLQMSGRAEEALVEADRARAVFEAHGEQRLLAQLECNVGNVHFRRDRFDLAVSAYERAIALFDALGDEFGRAFARYNVGNVLTNAHRFEAADEAFVEARAAFLTHGHQVLAADAEYALAYLDFRRGRWTVAIEAFLRAQASYLLGGKPTGASLCDLDLAELHLQLGAMHDAARHAAAAAQGFEALGMRYELAKARLFEGVAFARRGDVTRAESALRAAQRGFMGLGNDVRSALVTLHLAELRREPAGALGILAEVELARRCLERSGDVFLGRIGRLALAEAQLAAQQPEAARSLLTALLAECTEGGASPLDAALVIEARRCLADAAESHPEARAELERAIALIEATYAGLAHADARLAFFGARHGAYARLAALLLGEGEHVDEAIDWAERGRSRSRRERPLGAALAEPELAAARAELDGWLGDRLEASLEGPGAGARGRVHAASAPRLLPRQDELLRRARRHLQGAPGVAGVDDERASASAPRRGAAWRDALHPAEALLYFVVDRDVVHGVLRDGATATVFRARLSVGALIGLSERLRHQASKARFGPSYRARHASALERATASLMEELGVGLFADVADELSLMRARAVRIVPYGALHDLPLHAATLAGRALFQRCDASYARGLSSTLDSAAPGNAEAGSDATGRVLVCMDHVSDLPALAAELAGLRAVYGARLEVVAFEDLSARLGAGAPVTALHLAAHGAFQPDHPLFSGLRFGARSLTALDVEALRLGGAIVTLSGCETSRQTVGRAEDPFGPERSFLVAGARAVLGSLWPVEDSAAAAFMVRFHAALAAGQSPQVAYTAALRQERGAARLAIDDAAWVLAEAPVGAGRGGPAPR